MTTLTEQSIQQVFDEAKSAHSRTVFIHTIAMAATTSQPELKDVALSTIVLASKSSSARVRISAQESTSVLINKYPELIETLYPITKAALLDDEVAQQGPKLPVSWYTQETFAVSSQKRPDLIDRDLVNNLLDAEKHDAVFLALTVRPDLANAALFAKIMKANAIDGENQKPYDIARLLADKRPDLIDGTVIKYFVAIEADGRSHNDIPLLVQKRPDLAENIEAAIFEKATAKKRYAATAYGLLRPVYEQKPELLDEDTIKKLMTAKNDLNENPAITLLRELVSGNTELAEPVLTAARAHMNKDTSVQWLVRAIVELKPELADASLAKELATGAVHKGQRSYGREAALETLAVVFDKQPELLDASWIRSLVKPYSINRDQNIRTDSMKFLKLMMERKPELADESIVKVIVNAAAADTWWRTRDAAQETLALVLDARPDLTDAASKAFPKKPFSRGLGSVGETTELTGELLAGASQRTKAIIEQTRADRALIDLTHQIGGPIAIPKP